MENNTMHVKALKQRTLPLLVLVFLLSSTIAFSTVQNPDSLINALSLAKNDSIKLDILDQLIGIYKSTDIKKGFEYANQACQLAKTTGKPLNLGQAYINLAILHEKNYDYDKALQNYTLSLKYYKKSCNLQKLAFVYTNIGNVYRLILKPDSSLFYYDLGIETRLKMHDSLGVYRIYNNLGLIYKNQAIYEKALEYFFQSLEGFEKLKDREFIAFPLQNIGNVYFMKGEYDQALVYYQKAMEIRNEQNDKQGIADLNLNIASIYMKQFKYTFALEVFLRSTKLYTEIGNKSRLGYCYDNIGEVFLKLGDLNQAGTYIKKGLDIRREVGLPIDLAGSLKNIALYYIEIKQELKAIENLDEAMNLIKSAGTLGIKTDIYECYSKAYENLGNYHQAYYYYKLYKLTNDSIILNDNTKKVTQLEMQYEFDKKQRIMEAQLAEKELALSQNMLLQKTHIIASIVLFVILIAFIILIIRISRLRKKNYEILAEHTQSMHQKNEELLQQQDHIINQRNDLEKLIATKDKFFSIIAHDLKNPFNAINGLTDLILRDIEKYPDNAQLPLIRMVNSTSKNTYALLENLLYWARSQTNGLQYMPMAFDLIDLIKSNLELLNENAKGKNITLSYFGLPNIHIFADQNMIDAVIRNFISNAIKFTPRGGEVRISVILNNNQAEISVEDTGIGMTQEQIQNLFKIEKVYSTEGTENELGTGLGLLICHEFVIKNGGSIQIKSEPEKGSRFSFSCPVQI